MHNSLVSLHAHAGLVEGMEGMVVGDERSIDSVFPETWHEPQSLRGVPCRCDIKVNELFEWDLPQARPPCGVPLR